MEGVEDMERLREQASGRGREGGRVPEGQGTDTSENTLHIIHTQHFSRLLIFIFFS